ncbi:MAG: hypothetical protein ACYCPN_02955 [Thermoplasmata archaeon]
MPDSPTLAGRAAVRRFRYLAVGLWALRLGVIVIVLYLVLRTVGGVP